MNAPPWCGEGGYVGHSSVASTMQTHVQRSGDLAGAAAPVAGVIFGGPGAEAGTNRRCDRSRGHRRPVVETLLTETENGPSENL